MQYWRYRRVGDIADIGDIRCNTLCSALRNSRRFHADVICVYEDFDRHIIVPETSTIWNLYITHWIPNYFFYFFFHSGFRSVFLNTPCNNNNYISDSHASYLVWNKGIRCTMSTREKEFIPRHYTEQQEQNRFKKVYFLNCSYWELGTFSSSL